MSPPPGSPKASKRVHYERGTKSGSHSHSSHHHHHRSRDSGFGSGSASDSASNSASLGTQDSAEDTGFDITSQRHTLPAVREALDAANDRIRVLEMNASKLNAMLVESNKGNRLLKREKKDLVEELEGLRRGMAEMSVGGRTGSGRGKKSSETRRTTTPPRPREKERSGEVEYVRPGSSTTTASGIERRMSASHRRDALPKLSNTQNPFMPFPERSPVAGYPPAQIAYPSTTLPYVSGSLAFAQPPLRAPPPNDGRYHLTPI